ncbi:MAG TPA: LysR family transcriptional regulator [Rhodoferax sp.]|nr:LysR family transcriptional regulator [Rhodoferax sp.]
MHAVVLKYFLEVARCGSIRKAAQNLFVASSAVNRQILRLEDELGTELFDRVPTGIRLNAAGDRLLQHVRGTLHDYHLMRTELDALKGERKGHVSVAAMDSLLIDFLPTAVEEFSETYPAVQYAIQSAMPSDVPEQVMVGDYDIGICYIGKLPAGLEVVATAPFPPGVVMASSHPLAKRTELSFDDCRGHAFMQISRISPIHNVVLPAFSSFWDELEPAISCNSTTMVKRLLIAGRGISFFSKIGFMDELARGEVMWRPLADPAINAIKVGIVIPTHRTLSHVTLQFVERITRRLKQLELSASMID